MIEEWEHFHQVFNEAIRQWRPRLRPCIRAHGMMGDILNTDFSYVCCLHTRTQYTLTVTSCLRGCYTGQSPLEQSRRRDGHLMFWSDLTKPIITNANVDRIY